MIENLLQTVIEWWGAGVTTIPVKQMQKVAAVSWAEYQNRLPSPLELCNWFMNWQGNYGVMCGKRHDQPGHLAVMDFDNLDLYFAWLGNKIPDTYSVATNRGAHVYYSTHQETVTRHLEGLDIKGSGYVLGAGSIHPSGAMYQVISSNPIAQVVSIYDLIPAAILKERPTLQPDSIDIGPIHTPQAINHNSDNPGEPMEALDNPIGANLITTIRERIPLLSLFKDVVKTKPGWYLARCPFHDDHNPSFWIDEKHGLCNCYACRFPRPMDVINLFSRIKNISNTQAVEYLQKELAV